MEFRRSGQRVERRRRVLMEVDEFHADAPAASETTQPGSPRRDGGPGPAYGEGARGDRQPRIIDLVPQRGWTLLVLALLLVTLIAALEALYGAVHVLSRSWHGDLLAPLDLDRPDGLARWFAALLLIVAALVCPVIYSLRRFRLDDYRGRYRIWLAATALLLTASLETVAGMRRLLALALEPAMPRPISSDTIGLAILTLVSSALLVRLLIEMCASRLACLLAALVACCYGGAVLVHVSELFSNGPLKSMLLHGLLLGGHSSVLLAVLTYARHCHLDAHGRIVHAEKPARKARKAKKTKPAAETKPTSKPAAPPKEAGSAEQPKEETAERGRAARGSQNGKQIRIDAAHSAVQSDKSAERKGAKDETKQIRFDAQTQAAPASAGPTAQATLNVPATADAAEPDEETRGLSKAERRRLKKQRRG